MMLCKRWSPQGDRFVISCHLNYSEGCRYVCYAARITGEDPLYGLSRTFVSRHRSISMGGGLNYEFALRLDGIYEFAVKTVDALTGELIRRDRKWLVLFRNRLYEYDEEELDLDQVLLTVFNLQAQEEEIKCDML